MSANQGWSEKLSQPKYTVKSKKDVFVTMRDGTRLAIDIYYPDANGKFPALLAYSPYSKEMQKLPIPISVRSVERANGPIEAGDTEYFVSRGYVHIIADARGTGNSEGGYRFLARKEQEDGYDLIEWMANQPWCDGNVGMVGMSYFGMIQYPLAALNPPHLKAVFPYEACSDIYRGWAYHGGILNHGFTKYWWPLVPAHTIEPLDLPESEIKRMIETAKNTDDIKNDPSAYLPLLVPNKNPLLFDLLTHPLDGPYYWERSAYTRFDKIKIPVYSLTRWNTLLHLRSAFNAYAAIAAPQKLRVAMPHPGLGFDRPWHEDHDLILRWYDHWLKGIDTGIMDEPPISILNQTTNEWRYENEWPLARTKWTKLYLRENGMLGEEPPTSIEKTDSFTYKPWLRPGQEVPSVKYTSAPLSHDMDITGPSALYFYASLSTNDANWHIEIYDIDKDGSKILLVSMGWLKASHREMDEQKSKPYQPYHLHTRSLPVKPGEICQYAIDLRETSCVFKAGHRIQLIIKGQDTVWEGPEYFRRDYYHLENSKETLQTIHHTPENVSYLLLPVIP